MSQSRIEHALFAVVLSRYDEINRYIQKGLNVLFKTNQTLVLLPHGIIIETNDVNKRKYAQAHDYDVLRIYRDFKFEWVYKEGSDAVLLLTNKCNENCIMCPCTLTWRQIKTDLGRDYNLELLDYFPSDISHLCLTGGEPTLIREGLFDVLDKVNKLFPYTHVQMLTNGRTFANKSYFEKLQEHFLRTIVFGIPLYGSTPEKHDLITQVPGGFKQTVLGIHHLLGCHQEVEIRIVASKLNYYDIENIAYMIVSEFKGISSVKIMGLEMMGMAAAHQEDVWIDYQKAFKYSKEAIKILIRHGIDVQLYNFPLCKVERGYWNICSQSITPSKIRYSETCQYCLVKDMCGGVFGSTLKVTQMTLDPILEL